MIRIICVGKIKEDYLVKMIEDYSKRINKYHKLEIVEIIDTNKKEEGIKILQKLNNKSYKVALTIEGSKMTSPGFSNFIDKNLMNYSNIDFILGGSNGIDSKVLKEVN